MESREYYRLGSYSSFASRDGKWPETAIVTASVTASSTVALSGLFLRNFGYLRKIRKDRGAAVCKDNKLQESDPGM